jgi:hypothetical protein
LYGEDLRNLCFSMLMKVGKRLRPESVRFSMAMSIVSSVYSSHGMGLVDELRHDDGPGAALEARLELQQALRVETEVVSEVLSVLAEALVEQIVSYE